MEGRAEGAGMSGVNGSVESIADVYQNTSVDNANEYMDRPCRIQKIFGC